MKTRYIFLLYLLLGLRLVGQAQTLTTYQAESSQLVAATIGTGAPGYTGSGFVEYITQQGSSALIFTLACPRPGPTTWIRATRRAAPPPRRAR